MHLRDSKPGLFNASMWDFLGGGGEGDETPVACAMREVREEFGVELAAGSVVWEKIYPAQKDPNQKAYFMVAKISQQNIDRIQLTEGQKWSLFDQETFFKKEDIIEALKERFRDYLDTK